MESHSSDYASLLLWCFRLTIWADFPVTFQFILTFFTIKF